MGHDHAFPAITWLHSSVADERPHIYIGTGNEPWMVRALCDPPGHDSDRPWCWAGPDRYTVDEAIADANAHAPEATVDVPTYEDIWPMVHELEGLLWLEALRLLTEASSPNDINSAYDQTLDTGPQP